ncbi:MAG: hypothetical protein D4R80_06245 [Deltaproteobacteria bacterium]|nr:MAG: hypothetical protein D4R80_06245 [Deltaproteobacteria bacterium]
MRKGFLIMLAVVLVAALAAPAMAAMDVTGFVRSKGYMSNFKNGATAPSLQKDAPTASYVEQRFRAKFSFGEENVKAVWFIETDFGAFGDVAGSANTVGTVTDNAGVKQPVASGAGRNGGGALGGDRINLETKNIYIWFKLPNTSLDFTVGLQNQSDAYAGLLFGGADMAGIFAKGKMEPVDYVLGWAKFYENNNLKSDDLTLYVASAKFAPTKDLKVGANLYFIQDDTGKVSLTTATAVSTQLPSDAGAALNKKKIYTPGVDVSFAAGPATISGFGLYQFGKIDYLNPATSDVDVKGFALDMRGDVALGPGKLFVEGLYVSGGDNVSKEYKSIKTLSDMNASPGGNSFFARTDMMILLPNGDDINTSSALVGAAGTATAGGAFVGNTSPGNGGRGITHLAAGYTQKLGDKLAGKVGAGYLAATKKLLGTDDTKKGKGMGTELNANVNYNIQKGLDFGMYAAYAWLGDFYKSNVAGAVDPDNVYDVHFRLNYAF